MIMFSSLEEEHITEDSFILSRKTFMQLCMFILYSIMLHLDGICYALHDAMLCNAILFMQYYLCNMLMHGQAFGFGYAKYDQAFG